MDGGAQPLEQAQVPSVADRRAFRIELDHEPETECGAVSGELIDPRPRLLQPLSSTDTRLAQASDPGDVVLAHSC